MVTLGEKLKALRKEAGISQFDLETEVGLAYGSLSRMESNQTTPTRHTLVKLADALKLNDRQFDYLIGARSAPPTEAEIRETLEATSDLWNDPQALVILRDDHFRIIAATKGLKDALGVTEEFWKQLYLRNIASIMIDPRLPFAQGFDPEKNPNAAVELKAILYAFFHETRSMEQEPDYQQTVAEINANPFAKMIWEGIVNAKKYEMYLLMKDKHMTFHLPGGDIHLSFYTEALPYSSRFFMMELIALPQ